MVIWQGYIFYQEWLPLGTTCEAGRRRRAALSELISLASPPPTEGLDILEVADDGWQLIRAGSDDLPLCNSARRLGGEVLIVAGTGGNR